MVSDEELIYEIKRGSQGAMEVLVKRYYRDIFSYVYRNTGEYHLSYDITQEIFEKMMKSIKRYHESGRFKNWLYKIAVNSCTDYFRSSFYKKTMDTESLDDEVSDDSNVWDLFSRNAEREKIKRAVLELPEYQRNALILRFYHDMKVKDIAEATGCSEGTVKSRLRQGMEKLRKVLGGGEEYDEAQDRF